VRGQTPSDRPPNAVWDDFFDNLASTFLQDQSDGGRYIPKNIPGWAQV
jgi:hypothetical protein